MGPALRPVVAEDLTALLRRRLLVVFSICAAVGGFANLALILFGVADGLERWDVLIDRVWGGLVALLASRRALSLTALRACELVGFGVLAVVFVWWTFFSLGADNLGGSRPSRTAAWPPWRATSA
jgi:hypothetical protein